MQKSIFLWCFFILFSIQKLEAQLTYPNIIVLYDSAWTYKNLDLIPIIKKDTSLDDNSLPKKILSFQQAMLGKKLQVKENVYTKEANVNVITIKNISKEYVFVASGELVQGGKQDRYLAESKILAPGKEAEYFNVYCIEKGRWSKKPKPFNYGGYANINVRKAADSSGVQQHVWKEIEKQFTKENVEIKDYPYIKLKEKKVQDLSDYFNFFRNKYKQSDSTYIGFIAVSDSSHSTIIGCDVFANERLLAAEFENILYSYIEGITNRDALVKVNDEKVKRFSNQLFGNEESQKKFLEHNGKIFTQNNKTLHIVAYGN